MTDHLLTTREVAGFLGMSPESVLRRYRRGQLPGYRLSSTYSAFVNQIIWRARAS